MTGVMEAGFCLIALRDGFIPGNANLVTADESCEGLDLPRETKNSTLNVILNNTSGFGGSNVCHVLRRYVP
jgi:3-oxoacyl-(acyl-carrier-protein) synthase